MSEVLEIYDVSTEAIEVITQGPQGPPGSGGGGGGGSGTVTSVALAGTGLSITGSPVTASGTITANVSYGTTAGTACQGNDSRLSDARTPTAHTHVAADITDLQTNGNAAGLWDSVNDEQLVSTGDGELQIRKTGTALSGAFNASVLSANRGYNLPDASGTLALTTTVVDNATGLWDSVNSVTGAVVSDYELSVTDGTNTSNLTFPVGASRNYTFPNATGTVALTSDITKTAVGLGNVTNNAQTQAAIVPNTAPSAGQLLVGNAGGTAYAPVSVSGDATLSSTGALTVANNAVTNAKLAQIATSTIKGRATPGTGNVEDLSSAQVLTILGLLGAIKDMKIVSPSSDVTATSSTTLSNVTGMSFSVAANTTYLILTNLQMSVGAGGYNCEISFPSILNNGTTAGGFGIQLPGSNSVAGLSTTSATTVKVSNRGAAQTTPSFSILLVRTDSTGGTANFQWAQNAINAAASTLSSNTRALIVPLTT